MRVTEKQLQGVVDRINEATKSPMTSYTKTKAGKFSANIGNFHLDFAYGGVALHRMQSKGGGIEDIFGGHYPKRELFNRCWAYLDGIQLGNKK